MERMEYEKEYIIIGVKYSEFERMQGTCYAAPAIELKIADESGSISFLDLFKINFVQKTKNYWWDGTEWGAHNLNRKLWGKKFSFKTGIE